MDVIDENLNANLRESSWSKTEETYSYLDISKARYKLVEVLWFFCLIEK